MTIGKAQHLLKRKNLAELGYCWIKTGEKMSFGAIWHYFERPLEKSNNWERSTWC
jgi:hypothetical protein